MPKYTFQRLQIHGIGLFATEDIEAGETIFLEEPILSASKDVLDNGSAKAKLMLDAIELSDEGFSHLRSQCFGVSGREAQKLTKADLFAGREEAVSLLLTTMAQAGINLPSAAGEKNFLFGDLSKVNHACRPNCEGLWVQTKGAMLVKATRKTGRGDEIVFSYLSGMPVPFLEESERRKALSRIGIVCRCDTCTLIDQEALQAESWMGSIHAHLNFLLTFRRNRFGDREGIDLFKLVSRKSEFYDGARAIRKEFADTHEKVEQAIRWMKENAGPLQVAHSSVSLVYEVEYLIEGAIALCGYMESHDSGKKDVRDYQGLTCRPDFQRAFQAKLRQLQVLDTCIGMWHAYCTQVLAAACSMTFNDELAQQLVEILNTMAVSVKVKFDEDGKRNVFIYQTEEELKKIEEAKRQMGQGQINLFIAAC